MSKQSSNEEKMVAVVSPLPTWGLPLGSSPCFPLQMLQFIDWGAVSGDPTHIRSTPAQM